MSIRPSVDPSVTFLVSVFCLFLLPLPTCRRLGGECIQLCFVLFFSFFHSFINTHRRSIADSLPAHRQKPASRPHDLWNWFSMFGTPFVFIVFAVIVVIALVIALSSSSSSSPSSLSPSSALRYRRRRHRCCRGCCRSSQNYGRPHHPSASQQTRYLPIHLRSGWSQLQIYVTQSDPERERERKREIFIYGNVPRRSSTKSHVTLVAVGKKRNVILFKRRTSSCEVRRPRDNDFFIWRLI